MTFSLVNEIPLNIPYIFDIDSLPAGEDGIGNILVWIDFNGDGSFDASEGVLQEINASSI